VVATPIGNIFDVTLRAIYILRSARYIFAEDSRVSRKLLSFYQIKTPLVVCHEYNETDESVTSLLAADGVYALVSDAGTPLVSDPGYRLVNWCIRRGIPVFPAPGPCSPIAALSVSGLPTDGFLFQGFLPPKSRARRSVLENIRHVTATLVFLEAPHRLAATLADLQNILGDRICCLCREITKVFEESLRGRLSEIMEFLSQKKALGEYVILVAGHRENNADPEEILFDLSESLRNNSVKSAVVEMLRRHKVSRNAIYKKALEIKGKIL
jgi:16S rRNA (cytidine1402-2'-O)-methyltransferase